MIGNQIDASVKMILLEDLIDLEQDEALPHCFLLVRHLL